MSRNRFGAWGLELNNSDFACALAALGVWQHKTGVSSASKPAREDEFNQILASPDALLHWRLVESPEQISKHPTGEAASLVELWKKTTAPYQDLLRILIDPRPNFTSFLPWLVEVLKFPAIGAQTVIVLHEDGGQNAWHWPLQIGLLDNPVSNRFSKLPDMSWAGVALARIKYVPKSGQNCDILLLPGSFRQSLMELSHLETPIHAGCILFLTETGGTEETRSTAWHLLMETCQADGLFQANIPAADQPLFINRVVYHLSHNLPLDSAFKLALIDVTGSGKVLKYELFATAWLLERARLQSIAAAIGKHLKELPDDLEIALPALAANRLFLEPGFYKGKDLSNSLDTKASDLRYDGESHAASGVASLSNALDAIEKNWARQLALPRWLQAKVYELIEDGSQRPAIQAFTAGHKHAVDVRIGPEDAEWLTPPSMDIFPEWQLPTSSEPHRLTVIFSEPIHSPEPQVDTILLPPSGESSSCRFYFQARKNRPDFNGRIIIAFRNRILQTAILSGRVMEDSLRTVAPGEQIGLTIETITRPNLAGLNFRRPFDAALVTNHTPAGEPLLTEVSGDRVRIVSLEGITKATDRLRRKLQQIADNPKDYPTNIHAKATVSLLRYLALQGSLLHLHLVQDQVGDAPLATARRIQIISATTESFLPIELLYDRPAPSKTAKLCENSLEALETGSCSGCIQTSDIPNPTICPLGFWGLSRVIERHTNPPGQFGRVPQGEFDLCSEPFEGRDLLTPLSSAVYAASSRVDAEKKGLIQQVLDALQTATNNKAASAVDWEEWKQDVQVNSPSLLLLLPHTFTDTETDIPCLEIGEDQQILAVHLKAEHVRTLGSQHRPIVLLLGCDTIASAIPFQSFVSQFRSRGAAIVIGTATQVRGRHAAPTAVLLVEVLAELARQSQFTFGEVMLQLRRRALAKGLPVVLTLFPYGDADWRLAA